MKMICRNRPHVGACRVEKRLAALEGGVAAMCTSSGQAASLCSILNICQAGDSFIASSSVVYENFSTPLPPVASTGLTIIVLWHLKNFTNCSLLSFKNNQSRFR